VLLDEHRVDAQGLGAAESEAEVAGVLNAFDQEQERGRLLGFDPLGELFDRHPRLGADQGHDAAVALPVGHGVELSAVDGFDRDVELTGEFEQVGQLLHVGAVADQDDLKHALAGAERGENGLSAFQVFHAIKAAESKPKARGFR